MEPSSSLEDIKSTVNIRALITAYENKATNNEITYSRPRTRSLGNVLSKNVLVKENQIRTLNDVHEILKTIEQHLNHYEIYNKEKHVTFQEELFNTLTSIINIDNGDPEEAKALISKTKSYVSFLNTKLPSNAITSNYSSHVAKFHRQTITKETLEDKMSNSDEAKTENNDEIDSVRSAVPVKTLKQIFQVSRSEKESEIERKTKKITYNTHIAVSSTKTDVKTVTSDKQIVTHEENQTTLKVEEPHDKNNEIINDNFLSVSVLKLKSIFETKSKENASGLPLILNENKPPITRYNYKSNLEETTRSEDLEHIQVSSYIKTMNDDTNRLLDILKREKQAEKDCSYDLIINEDKNQVGVKKEEEEFDSDLNYNNEDENTGETNQIKLISYLENHDFDQSVGSEYTDDANVDGEEIKEVKLLSYLENHDFDSNIKDEIIDEEETNHVDIEKEKEEENAFNYVLKISNEDGDTAEINQVEIRSYLETVPVVSEYTEDGGIDGDYEFEDGTYSTSTTSSEVSVKSADSVKRVEILNSEAIKTASGED